MRTGASLIDVLRKKRKASSHSWRKRKHGYRLHNRRKESAGQDRENEGGREGGLLANGSMDKGGSKKERKQEGKEG